MSNHNKSPKTMGGEGLAIGIALGLMLGMLIGNLILGLIFGAAVGFGHDLYKKKK